MHDTVKEEVDYGPLAALVGTWKGDDGMDVAPEPDDDERNPYYETIVFEEAGDRPQPTETVPQRARSRGSSRGATLRLPKPTATPPCRPTYRRCRAGNATSDAVSTSSS